MPTRTCVGCRKPDSEDRLLRLVARDDQAIWAPSPGAPGRGAYVHDASECLETALTRRSLQRALRVGAVAPVVREHLSPAQVEPRGLAE